MKFQFYSAWEALKVRLLQIKDEKNNFKAENFKVMQDSIKEKAGKEKEAAEKEGNMNGRAGGRGRGRGAWGRGRGGGRDRGRTAARVKQDTGQVSEDIVKILKMAKARKLEPVIVFSFARRFGSHCERMLSQTFSASTAQSIKARAQNL